MFGCRGSSSSSSLCDPFSLLSTFNLPACYPTVSVGVIGLFVWGAMYLARMIEYEIQAGWSLVVPFVGLLSLSGLGAAESGVNFGVISVVAIALAFVSVVP